MVLTRLSRAGWGPNMWGSHMWSTAPTPPAFGQSFPLLMRSSYFCKVLNILTETQMFLQQQMDLQDTDEWERNTDHLKLRKGIEPAEKGETHEELSPCKQLSSCSPAAFGA